MTDLISEKALNYERRFYINFVYLKEKYACEMIAQVLLEDIMNQTKFQPNIYLDNPLCSVLYPFLHKSTSVHWI